MIITDTSLKVFFDSIKIHGEHVVVGILKKLKISDNILKKYIENIVCKEFHITIEKIKGKNVNFIECKEVLSFFYKKYLNYRLVDIANEINVKNVQTISKYIKNIKELNSNIKPDRELINKIQYIDNQITKFINNLNNGKESQDIG